MESGADEAVLLTLLAQKERAVEGEIVRARADADRIVEEARGEAARVIEEAKAERRGSGERLMAQMREQALARADRRIAEIDAEIERLEALGEEDIGRMAEEILGEIFPEFAGE